MSIEHEDEEGRSKKQRMVMILVFTFVLGILTGLAIHDAVVQQVGTRFDMKSWYPR
jgi:hypothetical protein